jgi:hypothetical protein
VCQGEGIGRYSGTLIALSEADPLEPQVRSTKNLVLKQLLAGSFSDNFSRGEDIVAGGHFEDRAHVLFNEQDGDP